MVTHDDNSEKIITPFELIFLKEADVLPSYHSNRDLKFRGLSSKKETVKELKNRDRLRSLFYKEFYNHYIISLQSFHEKTNNTRELTIGDIVIINDSKLASYSQYPLGKVIGLTHSNIDNKVRSAKMKLIGENSKLKDKILVRDRKMLTLLEIQSQDIEEM